MFVRRKKSGIYEYLQIVHNERIGGRVKQRVIATQRLRLPHHGHPCQPRLPAGLFLCCARCEQIQ